MRRAALNVTAMAESLTRVQCSAQGGAVSAGQRELNWRPGGRDGEKDLPKGQNTFTRAGGRHLAVHGLMGIQVHTFASRELRPARTWTARNPKGDACASSVQEGFGAAWER